MLTLFALATDTRPKLPLSTYTTFLLWPLWNVSLAQTSLLGPVSNWEPGLRRRPIQDPKHSGLYRKARLVGTTMALLLVVE